MIELKITSDTAAELAKHLAELAGGFLVVPDKPNCPVMPEVAEAQITDAPKRTRRTKEQIAADNAAAAAQEAAAEQDAGEGSASEGTGDAGAASGDSTAGIGTSSSTTTTSSTATNTASRSDAATLDFDKDVAPVVLGYVKSKGKPWVVAILNQFGVERASELPPGQFGELVAALHDAANA